VLLRMVEAGVTPDEVSWNTLMQGYRTGEERNEVLLRMVEAGVTPNDVSWNTLMQGFADERQSLQCLSTYCRMQIANVSPDSFTLSILFSCLVRDGSRSAIGTVIHIAASRVVSHSMINHFVAHPVLCALAFVGHDSDIVAFWRFCARHLGRSKEGWPGRKTEDILRQRCRKYRGSGWVLLLSLIDGTYAAGCTVAWPPAVVPPPTDMMARAASLAASGEPTSLSASDSFRAVVAHPSHSSLPPAPVAPAAAAAAASGHSAAASSGSRSIQCQERDCRCVAFYFYFADEKAIGLLR
jgi:pentatricopeptide repeat protein